MALADFARFKHGLCKSCGIECFEGILLEPCLLQPCFHIAGCSVGAAVREQRQSHQTDYQLAVY